MSNRSVIVYGPQGCGKSLHSERIAAALGLSKIVDVDDFRDSDPVDEFGTLYLTHDLQLFAAFPARVKTMTFTEAMTAVRWA